MSGINMTEIKLQKFAFSCKLLINITIRIIIKLCMLMSFFFTA